MNKSKRNSIIAIGAGAAILGFLVKKSVDQNGGSFFGDGSLGGSDDQFNDVVNPYVPEGNPFQRIDPNYPYEEPTIYYPDNTTPEPSTSLSFIPNAFTPIPEGSFKTSGGTSSSSGSGGIYDGNPLTDLGVMGGAFALDAGAKFAGKGVKSAINAKYVIPDLPENKLRKFLTDPYGIDKTIVRETTEVAESKISKSVAGGVVETTASKLAKETAPKWAKWLSKGANFVPIIDIPIGAALDVYFTRNDENPIGWGDAIAANFAGEMAQLGITAGGALAGGVGAVPAWFVGTGADIAATEAYYKARGKSSLFDIGSTQTTASVATSRSINDKPVVSAQSNNPLFEILGYNPNSSSVNYTPVNLNYTPALTNASASKNVQTSGSSGSSKVVKTASGQVVNISKATDPIVRAYENKNLVSTSLSAAQINIMNQLGISTINPIASSSSSKSSSSKSSSSSNSKSSSSKSSSSSSSKSSSSSSISKAKDPVVRAYENKNKVSTTKTASQIKSEAKIKKIFGW